MRRWAVKVVKQTVGRARLGGRGSRSIDTATYLPAHRINGSGTRRGGVHASFSSRSFSFPPLRVTVYATPCICAVTTGRYLLKKKEKLVDKKDDKGGGHEEERDKKKEDEEKEGNFLRDSS